MVVLVVDSTDREGVALAPAPPSVLDTSEGRNILDRRSRGILRGRYVVPSQSALAGG